MELRESRVKGGLLTPKQVEGVNKVKNTTQLE